MVVDPTPIDRLVALGPDVGRGAPPDYLALGLGPEHVPDLIALLSERRYDLSSSTESVKWAPVHACRALGLLRAAEAVGPLLDQIAEGDANDDDWCLEEVTEVLGQIGTPAIPQVAQFLADLSRTLYARVAAGSALEQIGRIHPEGRQECIARLVSVLEGTHSNDPTLNGFLVASLMELKAVEALDAIERAYAADAVDLSITGGWDEVRYELVEGRRPPWTLPEALLPASHFRPPPDPPASKKRAKSLRKMQKQARKRNRNRR